MCNNVNESFGVNKSEGINLSCGVNESKGVQGSQGVNLSEGVAWSGCVNWSEGVYNSKGVGRSYGVKESLGVDMSAGVNMSYGIKNCFGVDMEIFSCNKPRLPKLFHKTVSYGRFHKVWRTLHSKFGEWRPNFNNAFELYIQSGRDWEKVKASDICSRCEDDNPWAGMPTEAIDYLKSLPEFDAGIFFEVTGLDVGIDSDDPAKKKAELIEKANELLAQAEQL